MHELASSNVGATAAESLMAAETPEGYRAAAPLLRRAANAGDPWAAYHLGLMFDDGRGLHTNVERGPVLVQEGGTA